MEYREIVCQPSAFKHGQTEADIRLAFDTAHYDGPIEGYENKRLLIGFNAGTNPIEIVYNEFGDGGKNVFHAMHCRRQYLPLLSG